MTVGISWNADESIFEYELVKQLVAYSGAEQLLSLLYISLVLVVAP